MPPPRRRITDDPNDLWERYLAQTDAPSPQGALAFAFEAMTAERSDAFDFGFKAAGGSMIPDGARDMVELALDRDQIDALADAAEGIPIPHEPPGGPLARFVETVSIYRRRKA